MDPVVCCACIVMKLANIITARNHRHREKLRAVVWTISFRLVIFIGFVIKAFSVAGRVP
jgi:hypothetical protein